MLARTPITIPVDTTSIISGAVITDGIKTKFRATWMGDTINRWVVEITDQFGERTRADFVEVSEVWAQIGIGVAVATEEVRRHFSPLQRVN